MKIPAAAGKGEGRGEGRVAENRENRPLCDWEKVKRPTAKMGPEETAKCATKSVRNHPPVRGMRKPSSVRDPCGGGRKPPLHDVGGRRSPRCTKKQREEETLHCTKVTGRVRETLHCARGAGRRMRTFHCGQGCGRREGVKNPSQPARAGGGEKTIHSGNGERRGEQKGVESLRCVRRRRKNNPLCKRETTKLSTARAGGGEETLLHESGRRDPRPHELERWERGLRNRPSCRLKTRKGMAEGSLHCASGEKGGVETLHCTTLHCASGGPPL